MMKAGFALLMLAAVALTNTYSHFPALSSESKGHPKVLREVNWGPAPVEVADPQINDRPVSLDRPFETHEEAWIRELHFRVINRGKSDISHLRFELQFPLKDKPRPGFYVQPIEYGLSAGSGRSDPAIIKPGDSVQLNCVVDFNAVRSFVRQNADAEFVELNTALLSTEVVDFTDKTRWLVGFWSRFDDKTRKWIDEAQPLQQTMSISPAVVLRPIVFQPRPIDCFKSSMDSLDCQADCQCGTRHNVTIPGADIVSAGVTGADKIQRCCTNCVIAYTGTARCP